MRHLIGPRSLRMLIPALIVVALSVSAPAQAACTGSMTDFIVAPTGSGNPPPFAGSQMYDGTHIAVYEDSPSAGGYNLFAHAPAIAVCALGSICRDIPDFNVAWYDAVGNLMANHNNRGDHFAADGFQVPVGADFAAVYLSYGPDVGVSDGSVAAVFTFETGC